MSWQKFTPVFLHAQVCICHLQVPNVTDIGLKPRPVKKVAVIGGGLMGSGIATALILSNINVVLKEVNSEYLTKGLKMIEGEIFILIDLVYGLKRATFNTGRNGLCYKHFFGHF